MLFQVDADKNFSLVSLLRAAACKLLVAGAALALTACGGSSSGGDGATPPPPPPSSSYPLAGTISGLGAAGLVLRNNGGDDLSVPAHATSFRFATDLAAGAAYDVTIATQPSGLTCTVSHGSGSNVQAAVGDIAVVCNAIAHTISGTISGLASNGLVLRNNGGDDLAIGANAATFQFGTPVAQGSSYSVTVAAQPTGLTCTVGHGTGTQVEADIDNIQVTCSASTLTVGGTISGLTGSGLVLQNNAGDDLTVAANASTFEFATPIAYGGNYAVTVATQPAGQICTPSSASGTATTPIGNVSIACADIPIFTVTPSAGANGSISPTSPQSINSGGNIVFVATPNASYAVDQWLVDGAVAQTGGGVFALNNVVANHTVAVTFGQAVLVPSVATLALSVNDPTLNAALTGTPRTITITNTGSIDATNLAINYPAWPSSTTAGTLCGATLAPSASCTITVTPGSAPSAGCSDGSAPAPDTIAVTHDGGATQIDVSILSYGCLYQGGLLYAVNDSTPDTGSIGGSVVSSTDNATVEWDPAGIPGPTNALSLADGAANTAAIVATLGAGNYAAQICSNFSIDSNGNTPCSTGTCYTGWYLPAICEWGFDGAPSGSGCGTAGSPTLQNIQSSLVDPTTPVVGGAPSGVYWSSTEDDLNRAWFHAPAPGASNQNIIFKSASVLVRCARALQ
jgi:hypothetical protein